MRAPVRRRRRNRGRPLCYQARREVALARRPGHGGHLHLHLAAEGRRGASTWPAALRNHAQILSSAGREWESAGDDFGLHAKGSDLRPCAIASKLLLSPWGRGFPSLSCASVALRKSHGGEGEGECSFVTETFDPPHPAALQPTSPRWG